MQKKKKKSGVVEEYLFGLSGRNASLESCKTKPKYVDHTLHLHDSRLTQ